MNAMITKINKQQRFWNSLNWYICVFCTSLLGLFITNNLYAAVNEYEIQVDYSFNTLAVPDKDVSGYRLFKENEEIYYFEPTETQTISCTVLSESGTYNFYLSAVYNDTSESPLSDPFQYTLPDYVPDPVAPTLSINNFIQTLAENTDTTATIKVADIIINDPDQGTNNLSLSGPNADMFTIIGNELLLKAGSSLDFEFNTQLNISVEVDDPTISSIPEDSVALTINIIDVNEIPSIIVTGTISSLSEATDTNSSIKVAGISVFDDALGTNNLVVAGPDSEMFTISGNELFLRSGVNLDFETDAHIEVVVEVDDPTLHTDAEDSIALTIAIIDHNEPPVLTLENVVTTLPEDTGTANTVKIADLRITDDALGTNSLYLFGQDASMFMIAGTELLLNPGAALDFETNKDLNFTIALDDPSLPATPEDSIAVAVRITDTNEAPALILSNIITTLAENTDTTTAVKVADIIVFDDALGTTDVGLSGEDASLFVITGEELFIKAGAVLDFETDARLDVLIEADDQSLPATPEDSFAMIINITDVEEPEIVLDAVIIANSQEGNIPFILTLEGAASKGSVKSYSWTFGDGESALGASQSHTYQSAGSYTVTLTVSDADGTKDMESITITATEQETLPPEPTLEPIASVSSANAAGEAPLTVSLDGSSSTVDPNLTGTYKWDFGDGCSGNGTIVSHEFVTPGVYEAILTVTDSSGSKSDAGSPVIVSAPAVENELPVSSFTVVQSPDDLLSFTFDASNSSDPEEALIAYHWDFGDGSSSEEILQEHVFTEAGEYEVSLHVTDDQGETSISSQTVLVVENEEIFPFEIVEVQVTSEWTLFNFSAPFIDPVVIVGPASFADSEPTTVRIRNVNQNGFEIHVEEWDYLDALHASETLSFIVMEKGVYTLENGTKIEAGSFASNSTRFRQYSTQETFGRTPVIFTQVMTENESDAVTVRLRNIGNESFEYKLQEQESNKKRHNTETIGYIAWEPGSGMISELPFEVGLTGNSVTKNWFDVAFQTELIDLPFFFATMQTNQGNNTAVIRYQSISNTSALIKVEEEQSKDEEVNHNRENVGYLIIGIDTARPVE